jgi:hypothetical protein
VQQNVHINEHHFHLNISIPYCLLEKSGSTAHKYNPVASEYCFPEICFQQWINRNQTNFLSGYFLWILFYDLTVILVSHQIISTIITCNFNQIKYHQLEFFMSFIGMAYEIHVLKFLVNNCREAVIIYTKMHYNCMSQSKI